MAKPDIGRKSRFLFVGLVRLRDGENILKICFIHYLHAHTAK